MPLFAKVFRSKDGKKNATPQLNGHSTPAKPQWTDAWLRTRVDPEEVVDLLRGCTIELKSRALDVPFLLLPFRPTSDPSASRTFIRNYFFPQAEREEMHGETLIRELRMTDPMVLASVMKWCWSRLPGGVVTWEAYELFRVGERDSNYARDAFTTFLPISVDSDARVKIIRDFFDLMAAIAAHGKTNGLGGWKLSRFAGWWAFEHYDTGKGFEAGYKTWASAASATSHLFFAYLRSLSPENPRGANGILGLPISLQQLVEATEYPPPNDIIHNDATKVLMIVNVVSPTPFALLRRAKNFAYRDDDYALQRFANHDDPVQTLTDECRRVLKAISSTNQSTATSKLSTSLVDPSWSRFEDIGFGGTLEESDDEDSMLSPKRTKASLAASHRSRNTDFNRPTTPSWADFLSSGFAAEGGNKTSAPILLPPDKVLPPISTVPRGHSSQSHRRQGETESQLEPGELASIAQFDLDDSFWWVWMSSLAGEEPTSRKAAFGRCALIETVVAGGKWMIMEEQVKGAAPEHTAGAYIAEKKGFLGFTKRGRLTRRRSGVKKNALAAEYKRSDLDTASRVTILPDQHARIQAAAAELSRRKRLENVQEQEARERIDRRKETDRTKTNSTMSLQPFILSEASPAMKWASQYDKQTVRARYLGSAIAGKGSGELLSLPPGGLRENGSSSVSSIKQNLPPPPPKDELRERSPAPVREPLPAFELPTTASAIELEVDSMLGKPEEIPNPVANEPTPAPSERPSTPPRPRSRLRKKSLDISPEQGRPKKKAPTKGPPPVKSNPSGFRQFFGAKRSKSREPAEVNPPLSPADPNPAIAAARAALEGKAPKNSEPPSPVRPITFVKPAAPNQQPPSPRPEPVAVKRQNLPLHDGPPKTRRDEEYDKLSRVDTNEREHADREFSTFDHGPLTEQPAFAPRDSDPGSPAPEPEPSPNPQHYSVYSEVTVSEPTETQEPLVENENTKQMSPSDRWAQIRKNAAERAARQSEEQGRPSHTETRTDDGETSGEETIESRVARIKARVAELTGNMEASRR